jgi:hypothetical protein
MDTQRYERIAKEARKRIARKVEPKSRPSSRSSRKARTASSVAFESPEALIEALERGE